MHIPLTNGIALWLLLLLAGCTEQPGPLVGTLERDRVSVSAAYAEPIADIVVQEGQQVAAGEVLVRLDGARFEARKERARAERDAVAAQLAELGRGPRREAIDEARAAAGRAEAELSFSQKEFERLASLYRQQLISASDRDRVQTTVDTAQARYQEALARLAALLEGTTIEELAKARAQLRAAEAYLAELQEDLDNLTLRAPAAGRIDALPYEPGERAPAGQPLVIMLTGEPYARVYIPEGLRAQATVGRRARVFMDGLEKPLNARLRYVSADAAFTPFYALTEEERGRLVYLAELDITDSQSLELPIGMPVQARLLDAEGG